MKVFLFIFSLSFFAHIAAFADTPSPMAVGDQVLVAAGDVIPGAAISDKALVGRIYGFAANGDIYVSGVGLEIGKSIIQLPSKKVKAIGIQGDCLQGHCVWDQSLIKLKNGNLTPVLIAAIDKDSKSIFVRMLDFGATFAIVSPDDILSVYAQPVPGVTSSKIAKQDLPSGSAAAPIDQSKIPAK